MTASTNTILVELADGSYIEREGVFYAEEATRVRDGTPGVAVQYAREAYVPVDAGDTLREEPMTEFITKASLVGVYDDIASEDEPATDEYRDLVTEEE